MLTDHLQRESADFEACNLLLQCFFQTNRYELAEQIAEAVTAQGVANDCFENNRFLCRLLAGEYSRDILESFDKNSRSNPFTRLNLEVATESPKSWQKGWAAAESESTLPGFPLRNERKTSKAANDVFRLRRRRCLFISDPADHAWPARIKQHFIHPERHQSPTCGNRQFP
jgi:hypothetical protein